MDLVELTYRLTADFPDSERFGLVSQMRRASVSIPSNIAEAQGVGAPRWSLRYIRTAIGSSCEVETQFEVAVRLRMPPPDAARDFRITLDRVQKLLYGLRRERQRRLGITVTSSLIVATLLVRLLS